MARKQVDMTVVSAGGFTGGYQAKARETATGREVAYAFGSTSQEARAKVVAKVRSLYGGDAQIVAPA